MNRKLKYNTTWIRNPHNPVLPILRDSDYDRHCMNPWITKDDELKQYRLFYAGADSKDQRRICSATAPIDNPIVWERKGPLFDIGVYGSFDGDWCVLPHLVRTADGEDRIYYTGNSGIGVSLDRFPGLGVALSDDGVHYRKYEGNPVIPVSRKEGDPDALGIAGGSVLHAKLPDGTTQWRYYYTGCPTLGADVFLDQQKIICLAVSEDGLNWHKRGAVMHRYVAHDYENVAVAGPVVSQLEDGSFRMWYSAIGTRWGAYSICYAESEDGIDWNRGTDYGDNLQLGPNPKSQWENQMVEYPSVIAEHGRLRLFYTGNGYGTTGIGTALSVPLRATRSSDGAHIASSATGEQWLLSVPRTLAWESFEHASDVCAWQGPDPDGTIWYEQTLAPDVQMRVIVSHDEAGLQLRITLVNQSVVPLRNVQVSASLVPVQTTDSSLSIAWTEPFRDLRSGETQTACARIARVISLPTK